MAIDQGCFEDGSIDFFYIPPKINKLIKRNRDHYLADLNLKDYYFPILHIVSQNDGVSQKEIVLLVPYDKSRVSVVIKEMIANGFLIDDGKGRSTSIHLTEKGVQAVAVSRMYVKLFFKDLASVFTDEEKAEFKALMTKFNNRLDEMLEQP